MYGKQPINYATHRNFTFTVVATDCGEPRLSSNTTVFMEILEWNDHAPYFDPDFRSLDVRSDTPVGQTITRVVAKDVDSGKGRIETRLHSEFKITLTTWQPLANQIAPCEASANHKVPPFSHFFSSVAHLREMFPPRGLNNSLS